MNNAEKFINFMGLHNDIPSVEAVTKTTEVFTDEIEYFGVDKSNGKIYLVFSELCGLILFPANEKGEILYDITDDLKNTNSKKTLNFLNEIVKINIDNLLSFKNNFFGKTLKEIANDYL